MNNVTQVMNELKKCGSEQTRRIYQRHGAGDNIFGVKAADLKAIAKKIKGKQELACELYETGNYDAKYLAGLVALVDPARLLFRNQPSHRMAHRIQNRLKPRQREDP